MKNRRTVRAGLGLACWLSAVAISSVTIRADDLAQQVRGILSNRCFACHGPDEEERQGGLRMDVRESYLAEADSGDRPVIPGQPSASELFRRVISKDEDLRMPPPDFGGPLSDDEAELIRRWIASGAELPEHWSFVAPRRPALPRFGDEAQAFVAPEQWSEWQVHPVDRFVLKKQIEEGLVPSKGATRVELLRRLSLDLTGLPPTLEEVVSFLNDRRPGAYERQVDRLLASPAYGEHWARQWLDLARYADSAGYADDPPRTIWAYRDLVIQALNHDIPVYAFTLKQIAGDLLPDASEGDLIATAFHRNTLTNNEGGTNDEEFRNVAIVDRVNTTMAVWMGVTMACAQCHTHKYDPFTQHEYFQLFDLFNQTSDADKKDERPTIDLYSPEQRGQIEQWNLREAELQRLLSNIDAATLQATAEWASRLAAPNWKALAPTKFSSRSKSDHQFRDDQSVRVFPRNNNIITDSFSLEFSILAPSFASESITALGLRTVPDETLPRRGAGFGNGNFVVTGIKATLVPENPEKRPAQYVRIDLPGKNKILSLAEVQVFAEGKNVALAGKATQRSTDYQGAANLANDGNTDGDYDKKSTTHTRSSDNPWWELQLAEPTAIEELVVWNRTGGTLPKRLDGAVIQLLDVERNVLFEHVLSKAPEVQTRVSVEDVRPVAFRAAYADYEQDGFPAAAAIDGASKTGWAVEGEVAKSHLLTLVPVEPILLNGPATLRIDIEHLSAYRNHLLAGFRVETTSDVSVEAWSALRANHLAIIGTPADQRTDEQLQELALFYNQTFNPSTDAARKELGLIRDRRSSLKPATSVPVLKELPASQHRETFVQIRGNYKSLGDQVTAGTPAVFHASSQSSSESKMTRRDLAQWLMDDRNPLTARVWVNRLWETLFGIGIVRSSEEFGSQGDPPSHPQLLDWLACEIRDTGWDQKRMLRLLVTSQTYRQTSEVSHELLARDKDNRWLARGPRVRLSAEMVRDQALASAGLLSTKMFGPPVRPPQPDLGLKAAFGSKTDWTASEGEDRYRRGVYTTWRRSNPYPSMATFDAPSREVCTLRRDRTNTPLQALVTLNDPAFVEAAQALARRGLAWKLHSNEPEPSRPMQIEYVFRIATARSPTHGETSALLRLWGDVRNELENDHAAATQLATDPLGPLPQQIDPLDAAAMTAVCNVILNLDEVLMKR